MVKVLHVLRPVFLLAVEFVYPPKHSSHPALVARNVVSWARTLAVGWSSNNALAIATQEQNCLRTELQKYDLVYKQ